MAKKRVVVTSQPREALATMNDNQHFGSETTGSTKEEPNKKKGFKKLVNSVFGKKKRRRKNKKTGGGSSNGSSKDESSYDSYSVRSSDRPASSLRTSEGSSSSPSNQAVQEWIHGGANGLTDLAAMQPPGSINSIGGRGHSLSKITELPDEDNSSGDFGETSGRFRRKSGNRKGTRPSAKNKRGKTSSHNNNSTARGGNSNSSVSSRDSKRSVGSFFGRKSTAVPADPLSLVVLLVEPSSLRFELLSLDFDLTTKKKGGWRSSRKSNNTNTTSNSNSNSNNTDSNGNADETSYKLHLTVQDVLDQITPSALTDEQLRKKAAIPGACKGLIDRTGRVHFGGANLEAACASRPLRDMDRTQQQQQTVVSLSIPTYGGESHKDVLVGFFGTSSDDVVTTNSGGRLGDSTKEDVSNALELAHPIFADPNVVRLMETSGYDLSGWKPAEAANETTSKSGSASETARLGKPIRQERGTTKRSSSGLQLLLGILAVLVATFLAWSIVAGGMHMLPSLTTSDSNNDNNNIHGGNSGPLTLEGHVLWAYNAAKSWYNNNNNNTTDTINTVDGAEAAASWYSYDK